jgi:hypothetical protein
LCEGRGRTYWSNNSLGGCDDEDEASSDHARSFETNCAPDAKTILKISRALGPEVIEQLHRQVVEAAKRARVTHGRRFRIDTTVVVVVWHGAVGPSPFRTTLALSERECRA